MAVIDWNFFDIAKDLGLPLCETRDAPHRPGYYMLFSEEGAFIYVGKAHDLHEVVGAHFSEHENNDRIKTLARWAIWQVTQSVDDAEVGEGAIFDTWVTATGMHPIANVNKPPRSQISEKEQLAAKLRVIFDKFGSLAKKLPE